MKTPGALLHLCLPSEANDCNLPLCYVGAALSCILHLGSACVRFKTGDDLPDWGQRKHKAARLEQMGKPLLHASRCNDTRTNGSSQGRHDGPDVFPVHSRVTRPRWVLFVANHGQFRCSCPLLVNGVDLLCWLLSR